MSRPVHPMTGQALSQAEFDHLWDDEKGGWDWEAVNGYSYSEKLTADEFRRKMYRLRSTYGDKKKNLVPDDVGFRQIADKEGFKYAVQALVSVSATARTMDKRYFEGKFTLKFEEWKWKNQSSTRPSK